MEMLLALLLINKFAIEAHIFSQPTLANFMMIERIWKNSSFMKMKFKLLRFLLASMKLPFGEFSYIQLMKILMNTCE